MTIKLEHTEYGNCKDKGGWKYYCTVYLPSGDTWRTGTHGKTKRLAREKLDQKILAKALEIEQNKKSTDKNVITTGMEEDGSNTLVKQLKAYAVLKQSGKVKAAGKRIKTRSISDKNEIIRNLIQPYSIGTKDVSQITRKDISIWIDEMKAAGKGERRQKGAYNLLTDYYNNYYCSEIDTDFVNPAVGFRFDVKKSKANPMTIFDNEQTKRYLKACDEMGEKGDILQFILYTYCREGEADTLTWSDWNQTDLIHFHKTWSKDENGKPFVDNKPKTPNSDRYMQLPQQVAELLLERYNKVKSTKYGKPDAWIFPAIKDKTKALSESTTYNLHKQALKRAGLNESLRVHDLRHSGISFNIRNSPVDCLSALSRQAGHSSRAVTESIYEHVLDSQRKELAIISTEIYNTVCPWAQ